jgi:hypothetical protein
MIERASLPLPVCVVLMAPSVRHAGHTPTPPLRTHVGRRVAVLELAPAAKGFSRWGSATR